MHRAASKSLSNWSSEFQSHAEADLARRLKPRELGAAWLAEVPIED
jgi:hypothetical protein